MKPLVVTVSIPAETFAEQFTSAEEIVEGPDKAIPELQVLNHYAGRWDDEIAGKPHLKRRETAEWVLNGRFLRQCWSTDGLEDTPKASGITMMTFDPVRQVYMSWSFLAIGSVVGAEGIWDLVTRTMIWTDPLTDSGGSVVTESCFTEDGTNVWRVAERDAKGKVVREVDGKSVRQSV